MEPENISESPKFGIQQYDYNNQEDENFTWNETYFLYNETEPFEFPLSFRVSCYILYNLVFICGLLGNLLVYYTIHYTNPRMKTVQNYFLGNLALGDLLIVILCVPTGYIAVLWQYWPFGWLACHLISPVKAVGVFVSSYTLVALAVDRYMAIINPLRPGFTKKQAKVALVFIWIAALVTAIPVAVYAQMEVHIETGLPRCGEYGWESPIQELIYNLVLLFLQYIFPVCVLIYTYTRISLVVWGKRIRFNSPNPPSKGKRKTVILSLSVVTGYTLAWLPYNIIYMIYQHGPEFILDADWFPYVFILLQFLAMSHTTFNPVIYFWINLKFRRAFSLVFYSHCPKLAKYLGFNTDTFSMKMGPSWRTSSYQRSSYINDRHKLSVLLPKPQNNGVTTENIENNVASGRI